MHEDEENMYYILWKQMHISLLLEDLRIDSRKAEKRAQYEKLCQRNMLRSCGEKKKKTNPSANNLIDFWIELWCTVGCYWSGNRETMD